MDTPYSVTVLDEVTSTQEEARSRLANGGPAVVVAHRQTGGRGRSGSAWETAPRAVAVSAAWPWKWAAEARSLIPLVAGVAAHWTLGRATALKWPNDVLYGGGKVAGILVESADDAVVAGMGVNLHWPDAPDGVAALYSIDPGEGQAVTLATEWVRRLWECMQAGPEAWPRSHYLDACVTLGRDITWHPDGRGRAVDVGDDGSLIVDTGKGTTVSLSAGTVSHVRRASG